MSAVRTLLAGWMLMPCAAGADTTWRCAFEGMEMRFTYERADLAPGIPGEPPRRAIARVETGAAPFFAEPFEMEGGSVGFFDEAGPRMLVIAPDGTARFTDGAAQARLGQCERLRG